MSQYINRTLTVLMVLAVIAVFGMFSASGESVIPILKGTWLEGPLIALGWSNVIVFNLSIGYLVTAFFWVLVVYTPERKRRKVLRDNLNRRYQEFKEEVIQTLLWASVGGHDSRTPRELTDHKKFKAFFDQDNKTNWYAALNGLQGSKDRMRELTLALQMLSEEVSYVLNNLPIQDPAVHSLFKVLNESIYRLQHSDGDLYDQVKHVGGFVWGILARWDFAAGQMEADLIQEMIDRL